MQSGVYCIRNTTTGKAYVGGSRNLHRREIQHFSLLKLGNHKNVSLQDAHHEDANCLVFEVLELAPEAKLKELEQRYIDSGEFAYNMASSANGGNGIINHPDRENIIERMRDAKIGKRYGPEFSAKMSAAKSGENHHFHGKNLSEEHRARIGNSHRGMKRSAATCRSIGDAQIGEKHHRFEGYFVTPYGRFGSSRLAAQESGVPMGHAWISDVCRKPDRIILKTNFDRSPYLKANFDRSVIGKTWAQLGFGYEAVAAEAL